MRVGRMSEVEIEVEFEVEVEFEIDGGGDATGERCSGFGLR